MCPHIHNGVFCCVERHAVHTRLTLCVEGKTSADFWTAVQFWMTVDQNRYNRRITVVMNPITSYDMYSILATVERNNMNLQHFKPTVSMPAFSSTRAK